MITVRLPEATTQYVREDRRPTTEFSILLDQVVRAIRELQDTATDHETRITALEP